MAGALERLSKELGRLVGATALWKEARKRGIAVSKDDVKAFVEKISSKQVLAAGPESLGKSATTSIAGEFVEVAIGLDPVPLRR